MTYGTNYLNSIVFHPYNPNNFPSTVSRRFPVRNFQWHTPQGQPLNQPAPLNQHSLPTHIPVFIQAQPLPPAPIVSQYMTSHPLRSHAVVQSAPSIVRTWDQSRRIQQLLSPVQNTSTISNPTHSTATVQHNVTVAQQGQNNVTVEERAVVNVIQEGQSNGQNVQLSQTARIRVRTDLW